MLLGSLTSTSRNSGSIEIKLHEVPHFKGLDKGYDTSGWQGLGNTFT